MKVEPLGFAQDFCTLVTGLSLVDIIAKEVTSELVKAPVKELLKKKVEFPILLVTRSPNLRKRVGTG